MYLKVNNLIQLGGNADYKGLDINLIVGGTQLYFLDNGKNEAYFMYKGDAVDHFDLEVITEEQYQAAKREYEESMPVTVSPEEEIQYLKNENEQLFRELFNLQTELIMKGVL